MEFWNIEFLNKLWYVFEHFPEYMIDWVETHFRSGHRPLFFLTEHTVNPRGFWFATKLPVYYSSNKTVLFNWPTEFDFWVQILRGTSFLSHSPLLSYKQISSLLLSQPPYWCSFTLGEFVTQLLSGSLNLQSCFSLFEGSWFEVRFIRRPYFYDSQWEMWFSKTDYALMDGVERLGESPGQILRRVFIQSFCWGYWVALLINTPWPWRIFYPKTRSNWFWFRIGFLSFFKKANLWNPPVGWITLFLTLVGIYWSTTYSETFLKSTLSELCFSVYYLWMHFIMLSLLLYIVLARTANIINNRWKLAPTSIHCIADVLAGQSLLRRRKVLRTLISITQVFHFASLLLWLYILSPFLGYTILFYIQCTAVPLFFIHNIVAKYLVNPVSWAIIWVLKQPWLEFPYWPDVRWFITTQWQEVFYYIYYFWFLVLYIFAIFGPFLIPFVIKPYCRFKFPLLFQETTFTPVEKVIYVIRVILGRA